MFHEPVLPWETTGAINKGSKAHMSASSIMQRSNTFHNIAQLSKHSKMHRQKWREDQYSICHVMPSFDRTWLCEKMLWPHFPGVKISSLCRNNLLNDSKLRLNRGDNSCGRRYRYWGQISVSKSLDPKQNEEISIASKPH